MTSVRDKLKALKKDWKDADETAEFQRPPKGDYTGSIYDIELTVSSNDNPMVKIQIAIDSPGYEGRYVWDNIVITEKAIPMAKQKLAKLGVDVDSMDLEKIEEAIEPLRGEPVAFRLSYKANADDPEADPWPRLKYKSVVEQEEDKNPTRPGFSRGGKKATSRSSKKTTKKKGKKKRKF